MNLLILLAYLFLGKRNVQVVEVMEVKEAELMQALPKNAPRQGAQKLVVEITIDEAGKFSAKTKDDQLPAFLPEGEEPMKPLGDWLAKLQEKGPIQATLQVAPNTEQDSLIAAVDIITAQGVSDIRFAVIPEGDD